MRSRLKDWLIGAFAMLVVLVAAVAALWWVATTPPEEAGPPAGTSRLEPATGEPTPPADLDAESVWLGDVDLEASTVVLPDSPLQDVIATGVGVLSGPEGLVADRVELTATVPFQVIEAELGGDTELRAGEDGQVVVARSVEVLGRQLSVVATGTVEARDGLLVSRPASIDLGGPDVLSRGTAALVNRYVTIEHAIEGLPEGLVLVGVAVQDDGFRADLEGEDIVLVPGGGS
ncbi:DUF2993 domain-containing protein [Ornithinimicrobium flavum]|uniref:DUF2993 domain-containing protein n=1 Tax=Ornithinimicrobium flavum TaxID=1288636 RepID=UPI001EE7D392|nr:DUF2993 domain-containing protein [Ornithinimicrobium flavum]